jgi:ABC-type uncharacterized transport system substrate-binding protein
MRRIGLAVILALSLALAPLASEAQPKSLPRIGILAGQPSADLLPVLDHFRQELRKLGWIGTSYLVNEVAGKLVELLKEAVPAATSVAVFGNPSNLGAAPYFRAARVVGQALGVLVQTVEVRTPDDFEGAFAAIARERTAAIILGPDPLIRSQRKRVAEFAAQRRLPLLLHGPASLLDVGGLVSYAAKSSEYPRVVASYVDRILKGAKPADLPVQQPTEFELGVNLKAAKTLGLTIPQSLLLRANQVIE